MEWKLKSVLRVYLCVCVLNGGSYRFVNLIDSSPALSRRCVCFHAVAVASKRDRNGSEPVNRGMHQLIVDEMSSN